MLFCGACSDNATEEVISPTPISLDKPVISDISYNTAVVKVNIEGEFLQEKGICYSTTSNPNIMNNAIENTGASNSFLAQISGLSVNKTYYVKSYAIDSEGDLYYSEAASFKTKGDEVMEELENYEPPTYLDDYVSIADWDKRWNWNLANVHDPTVFKSEDGYYYMYQTDASYGNARFSSINGYSLELCRRIYGTYGYNKPYCYSTT